MFFELLKKIGQAEVAAAQRFDIKPAWAAKRKIQWQAYRVNAGGHESVPTSSSRSRGNAVFTMLATLIRECLTEMEQTENTLSLSR